MLLLQLQIFLIIAVLLIAKPVGNAFFISQFGSESLPYAYLLTAVAAAIISTLYAAALRYYSVLRVNLWSLGICTLSLLGFTLALSFNGAKDAVAVGLYLWVALFGVLAASQFWMMASLVFDIRQAKRLFGPIGAGAIAGGIVGGYLANIIAGTFGIRALLFVAIALLLPCILISIYVWRYHIKGHASAKEKKAKSELLRERPHTLILRSSHLLLLSGIIALSVITAKLIDYQFSALASARFADPDQLTAFFGFWFSTFNVIGLSIQLVLTHRVVQRIGVSGALLFLPLGLGLGAVMMLIIPGLGMAIFSRLVDGSLKQSLHRAGVEMLFLPVDGEIKGKIKTYIDVLIDSVAGGVGGLLLLLLIDGFGLSPVGISPVVFICALLWLICVLQIREEYLDAFRAKLKHLRPKKKGHSLKSRHKEVLAGFLRVLEEADIDDKEQQVLYVLERSEDLRDRKFREPIKRLIMHKSPAIRARALSALSMSNAPDMFEAVIPMLQDADPSVVNAALEYLITHHLEGSEVLIQEQLAHPDPEIGGSALIQLLLETRGNQTLRKRWQLNKIFSRRVKELKTLPAAEAEVWTRKLLVAAGRSGTKLGHEFISRHLRSAPTDIKKAAILAAGESQQRRWLLTLIDYLSEVDYRPYASSALIQYGNKLLRALPKYLKENSIDQEDLRRLPRVIENIPSSRTVDLLLYLLRGRYSNDLELRTQILRSLNTLRRDSPKLPLPKGQILRNIKAEAHAFSIVTNCLENQTRLAEHGEAAEREARAGLLTVLKKRRDGNLDRLFRLLGLRYRPADIIPIYRSLRTADDRETASGLEFLDNLLEPNLKLLVMPILEQSVRTTTHLREDSDAVAAALRHQRACFRDVLNGRDIRQKIAVLYLIGTLNDPEYLPLLARYRSNRDKRVRDLAKKAMFNLGDTVH